MDSLEEVLNNFLNNQCGAATRVSEKWFALRAVGCRLTVFNFASGLHKCCDTHRETSCWRYSGHGCGRIASRCMEWGAWQADPDCLLAASDRGGWEDEAERSGRGSGAAMMPRHPAAGCTCMYVCVCVLPWQAKHDKNLIKIWNYCHRQETRNGQNFEQF